MKGPRSEFHAEFAARLELACKMNPDIPYLRDGRNIEIAERMISKFGIKGKPKNIAEGIRKYLDGEMMPRPDRFEALAAVLGVDSEWLRTGRGGAMPVAASSSPFKKIGMKGNTMKTKNTPGSVRDGASPAAAKFLAAGLVMLGGGTVVRLEESGPVHFQAGIRGIRYSVHAVLARQSEDGWEFDVAPGTEDMLILGIIPLGLARFVLLDLNADDVAELGEPSASADGAMTVRMNGDLKTEDHQWREITSFSKRL